MTKPFKPMKATDADLNKVRFPCVVMPKIDGVRGLNIGGEAFSRTLKPIRNHYTRNFFSDERLEGLDGEMTAEAPNHPRLVNLTTSATSSYDGEPFIQWWIFDYTTNPDLPYLERLDLAERRIEAVNKVTPKYRMHLRLVPWRLCKNMEELLAYEEELLDKGYEGIIIRDPDGRYKHGRSTVREGGYLRVKRYVEELFVVTAVECAMENTNEATTNELGNTKRSTAQAGMVPKDMIGKIHGKWLKDVEWNGKVLFSKDEPVLMGPGSMTHDEREFYWRNQHLFIGKLGKCKTFPIGVKDKPRFPLFQTLVSEDDIG